MKSYYEHFGVPPENLRAAKRWTSGDIDKSLHIRIPTRKEVAKLKPKKITTILINWMCKSPTEIIPSRTQIQEVRDILTTREDAAELSGLITMCNYYITND
ncbi:MAG: hypothetical protein HY254_09315 [Burkholderiales bacterium]|nr:hypothetical protein [Burkholderiales bacterium]